ncbi:MAG: GAF domain-containing protein, partial [Candidatus Eisenbacteria bacterium]
MSDPSGHVFRHRADTEVALIALLTRFVRRHRRALVERVAEELLPSLPGTARREAARFLKGVDAALRTGRLTSLQRCIEQTAQHWSRLGVPRGDVHRALLSPVLPPDLFAALHGSRDPWIEVVPQFAGLLEAVPVSVLLADTNLKIRFANAEFLREEGVAAPIGGDLTEVMAPESRDWVLRQMRPGVVAAGPCAADSGDLGAAAADSRFGSVRLAANPGRSRLVCAVPLAPQGQPLGWLLAVLPEPHKALADPTLAHSLQHERDKKDKLAAMLAVSQAMMNTLELDHILATLAKQVRRVFAVDECTVFLYDEAEQVLKPAVCDVERFRDEVMSLRLKMGEGITGSVALSGRAEIVNVAEDDPRAVQVPGTPTEDISSLLCVPLHAQSRVVGVITLVNLDGRPFAVEDLEPATLFAGLCSAAIANARLY